MATLSNPVYYKNGVVDDSRKYVGFYDMTNYVVRYTLTTDANESANKLSIYMNSGGWIQWATYDSGNHAYVNNATSLYFKIGTDSNEFTNAGINQVSEATGKVNMIYRSGYAVENNLCYNVSFEGDALLLPSTTYYIWIYPGFSNTSGGNSTWGAFGWYDDGASRVTYTVTLSGQVGFVYIDNGSGFDKYLVYIDNGSSWDLYIPYIDNGSSWDLYS